MSPKNDDSRLLAAFLLLVGICLVAVACDRPKATYRNIADLVSPDVTDSGVPTSGELLVLTYNVAGLPQGISSSDPERNIPQISPLLNIYDLVLAQEDFWYHAQLINDIDHPFQSVPWRTPPNLGDMGDGLNRFSRSVFWDLTRTSWPDCNGQLNCASDCLATKGFSVARHRLAKGVEVDVYNLHMEAGGCPKDVKIRADSVVQLLETLAKRSKGVAVIMAGDFNLHEDDPEDVPTLTKLITEGGFTDACWSTDCGIKRIDRILVRSSDTVELKPLSWGIPPQFVTSDQKPLSDHDPVAALIRWRRR